jgi:mono/diheme cytochrome c family protein
MPSVHQRVFYKMNPIQPFLRMLRIFLVIAIGFSFTAAIILWATQPRAPFTAADQPLQDQGDPQQGRLVFAAGDCASCHASPGQSDRLRLGGGLALTSPFGTFRVPNISPDPIDGIGAWSATDLANAMIGGVSPRQTHYYPVFPYPSYTGTHLEDVKDLMAYLRTLQSVKGRPPPHDLFWLFRIRRFVGFWKILFFREGHSEAELSGDTLHDRGGYLVETIGHCAECHSSRNVFAAIKPKTRFAGGPDPEGTGFIPNITPNHIGDWSQDDISEMLKTGVTPDHGRVGSSMAEVVTNTAKLPQSDRDAIARYVKSLPSRPTPHP